jgi:hypothetical protein
MNSIRIALAFLFFVPTGAVLAYQPPEDDDDPPPMMRKGKKGDATGKEAKASPRLQKLRQLTYDRRPSAILKAWSKPFDYETAPANPIDFEMAALQRYVTLGNWLAVQKCFASFKDDEAKAGYLHLLQSLSSIPRMEEMMRGPDRGNMMQFMEKHQISTDDLVGLARAAPKKLEKDAVNQLGAVLRISIATGNAVEHVVARLKVETAQPKPVLTKNDAARLLSAAGQAAEAGPFLPALEAAIKEHDHDALNLLTRHYMAMHVKEKKTAWLENAWASTHAVLATKTAPRADQEEALKLAVDLAPKLKDELGNVWLEQSFTKDIKRGMDILATIGALGSQGLVAHPREQDMRLKVLQLQKTAVNALLRAAPPRAEQWKHTLTLLAAAWLREAEFSHRYDRSSSFGPRLRRDRYGNMFYTQDDDDEDERMERMMMFRGGDRELPSPIVVREIFDTKPSDDWLKLVDDGVRPKLTMITAQLLLKVGEEAKAFPYIEKLAKTHPDKSRELVNQFLTVWTKNHNPNSGREYTDRYMFMYGFEERANGIPLTRSKQERNLADLAGWVDRLRALKVGDLNEDLLTKAFTKCHSSAEVYRMEAIEKIFGSLKAVKPRTLAGLAQQMRENLAGLWREVAVQNDKKTNRKPKDIQVEVLRGYDLARAVIDQGIKQFPEEWALYQAKAALMHDEINYRQEVAKSSEFSGKRLEALKIFQEAARKYAAKVKDLPEDEETTQLFEQWMYASLGACDLRAISDDKQPDRNQPKLIRAVMDGLPGEAAERHRGKFANLLFNRLSSVNPAVKFRYLGAGFEIVGDHKLAHEAKKVFDYYKDLNSEIKLEAVIDGAAAVGHKQAFGVFVNLRHTRDIERESGGFGKYLQNQNATSYFSWNYGRPTNDYRDKFQSAATEALKEHFEVVSVTFQTDKVNSRAVAEYGWRYTPYAYLLLKPRGPQVDKLPPLRIDLDFLDTSGYVIIPIESAAVPIDCAAAKGTPRPVRKLTITQTLDERQADKGKLLLEVKTTALGLIGELDQVLDFKPDGFDIVKTDDQGLSVARFDPDAEQNTIVSERTWMITLKAKADQAPAKTFHFGAAQEQPAEMNYHRYQDADLATVTPEVSLEERYGGRNPLWLWLSALGTAVVVGGVAIVLILLTRKAETKAERRWHLPSRLTPFTVLALLKQLQADNHLSASQQEELRQSIAQIERHFFAVHSNGSVQGEPDLRGLAEQWLERAT